MAATLIVAGLAMSLAALAPAAHAADADAPVTTSPTNQTTVSEVIVNGVPYKETVLPTRLSTSSAYGLNLSVMDTPRNTTLLSTTQIETLNIDDPRAFSYLTSSSYTDAAFGTPNIPRIRTQYADLFYNGMRDSMTQNGYGVPINFDSFDQHRHHQGPGQRHRRAGAGRRRRGRLPDQAARTCRSDRPGFGDLRHGGQSPLGGGPRRPARSRTIWPCC